MNQDYADALAMFCPSASSLKHFARSASGKRLLKTFDRTLIWCGLLGTSFIYKPQTVLISAVHSKVIEIWILIPFGLYHSAYSCLRSIVDSTTAFGYYISHPVEWEAVVNRGAPWESRAGVMEFHARFTRGFSEFNSGFGVVHQLVLLYRELSQHVHGIPPEGLPSLTSIGETAPSQDQTDKFIDACKRTVDLLNLFNIAVFSEHLTTLGAGEYRKIQLGIPTSRLAEAGILLPKP